MRFHPVENPCKILHLRGRKKRNDRISYKLTPEAMITVKRSVEDAFPRFGGEVLNDRLLSKRKYLPAGKITDAWVLFVSWGDRLKKKCTCREQLLFLSFSVIPQNG